MRWGLGVGLGIVLLAACATLDEDTLRRAETHRQLAELKLQKSEVELAIREYEASLAIYNGDPEAHFGLSEAYRRKGVYDLAQQHLIRTLELDPGNLEARLNLGVVYLHQGHYAEAIHTNDSLLQDPTFLRPERALVNRGWAHYKSSNLKEAAEDFRAALMADGGDYTAHLNLGIVLYDQGEVLEAMREFKAALEILDLRPVHLVGGALAQTRFRLAQAYVKLGRHEQAVEQFRAATKEGGQGEWGRKSQEYLAVLE
jgi:tetratricopeptide (TPR) repeat protein